METYNVMFMVVAFILPIFVQNNTENRPFKRQLNGLSLKVEIKCVAIEFNKYMVQVVLFCYVLPKDIFLYSLLNFDLSQIRPYHRRCE